MESFYPSCRSIAHNRQMTNCWQKMYGEIGKDGMSLLNLMIIMAPDQIFVPLKNPSPLRFGP